MSNTTIDYGYIPYSDVLQKASLSNIYNFEPWIGWQVTYFPENFTNPTSGPIFSQLYFRQAMQDLVDQNTFISKAFFGYGYPTYGPVPTKPSSNFVDSFEKSNPYPYDPSKAVALLQANGWTVNAGGVSTCTSPGTGSGQCGAGVPMGAKASFNLQYESGASQLDQEMAQFKTDFAQAGIAIDLTTAPFDTVIGNATPASRSGAPGTWSIGVAVGSTHPTTSPPAMSSGRAPDPAPALRTRARTPAATVTRRRRATSSQPRQAATCRPCTRTRTTSPSNSLSSGCPSSDAQLSEINKDLQGTGPQDPLLQIYPENWRWS